MTEGTKSYLIGCHQFFLHPLWVIMAWKQVYGRYPRLWELICIFLHDIGICGRQYLSTRGAKNGHWELGASWAFRLFGPKGYQFCAGHTPQSGEGRSPLFPGRQILLAGGAHVVALVELLAGKAEGHSSA